METGAFPSSVLRTVRGYVALLEGLLITGMVGVVVLAVMQVFFRYVLSASLSWTEEALRYLMIWIAFAGIGLAYSRGELIGMDLLVSRLPTRLAQAIGILGRLLVLAMMLGIAWFGWQFAWKTREATATAIPVSLFWFHVSVAVGSMLTAAHVGVSIVLVYLGLETVAADPETSKERAV